MDLIKFQDLNLIPTSHDPNLLKYVLISKNKIPFGQLIKIELIEIEFEKKININLNEYIILIIKQGIGKINLNNINKELNIHDTLIIDESLTIFNNSNDILICYCITYNINN